MIEVVSWSVSGRTLLKTYAVPILNRYALLNRRLGKIAIFGDFGNVKRCSLCLIQTNKK